MDLILGFLMSDMLRFLSKRKALIFLPILSGLKEQAQLVLQVLNGVIDPGINFEHLPLLMLFGLAITTTIT